ncbi:AgrD family cyclic lactone autoinducer peptide [Marinicrinis lubricantis]|uniref:AgrD family cyclic lactone autoinducer peptide n=1 Tax=Marinicrinis lubricantis TaxID=2086470 RepID=A0ABW1IT39_9BACL
MRTLAKSAARSVVSMLTVIAAFFVSTQSLLLLHAPKPPAELLENKE